jgi:hypothetical protein
MEKKKIESFEDLLVWQKGITLVKQVYLLTDFLFPCLPSSPFTHFSVSPFPQPRQGLPFTFLVS